MAYVVMAYVDMAYVVMAFIVMASIVMASILMAYVYVVMGYVVMAYVGGSAKPIRAVKKTIEEHAQGAFPSRQLQTSCDATTADVVQKHLMPFVQLAQLSAATAHVYVHTHAHIQMCTRHACTCAYTCPEWLMQTLTHTRACMRAHTAQVQHGYGGTGGC